MVGAVREPTMTEERSIQPIDETEIEPAAQPDEEEPEGQEPPMREVLADIARRLPLYAQLATRLAADTRLATSQRSSLSGLTGRNLPLGLVPGIGPLLANAERLMRSVQTINVVLHQVQPEVAEEHLAAVGLTRAQVEADLRDITRITRHLGRTGVATLDTLSVQGARAAGRLVGKGLLAWRARQARHSGRQQH